MYEKIQIAIDDSEIAERVVEAATQMAALSHGEVWVLHLREREAHKFSVTSNESTDVAQAAVDAAVGKLASAGIKAQGSVRDVLYGYAAREIIADAKAHDASVIVMGSRGRSDLSGLLVGSTAHKVIHLADRPVLVVR